MDWSNEDYVRMYTRETADDLVLSWHAMALWRAMLCKFDRAGLIDTKRGHRGLAALVRMPADIVEPALAELLDDGRVQAKPFGYFCPNFMTAQTATKSDKQRQREARERRQAVAISMPNVTSCDADVTIRDQTSRAVTDGHEQSRLVTLTLPDPTLTVPDPSLVMARSQERAADTATPKPRTKSRRKRLPQEWTPRDTERQLAKSSGIDCDQLAHRFKRHYAASGHTLVDWDEKFASWIENEGARSGRGPASSQPQLRIMRSKDDD